LLSKGIETQVRVVPSITSASQPIAMINTKDANQPEGLSKSSRFNIRFMKRTNLLAVSMFTAGVLYKLIEYLFFN
jgi:hypothetical protein